MRNKYTYPRSVHLHLGFIKVITIPLLLQISWFRNNGVKSAYVWYYLKVKWLIYCTCKLYPEIPQVKLNNASCCVCTGHGRPHNFKQMQVHADGCFFLEALQPSSCSSIRSSSKKNPTLQVVMNLCKYVYAPASSFVLISYRCKVNYHCSMMMKFRCTKLILSNSFFFMRSH